MKIIHSVFTKGWGGLEKYPLTLVDELKTRGHQLVIVTLEGSKLHEEALKRNIKVYTIKKFRKIDLGIIRILKEIIVEESIDIVHMNSSREMYNWYFALLKFKNIRAFLSFHIGIPEHKSFIHKILYKRLNGALVISTRDKNKMIKDVAIDENKINLVFNGVDLNKFNINIDTTIREELGLKEEDILITAVGNLSKGKGILEFLKAGESLLNEDRNLFFIWVGDDAHIGEDYTLKSLRTNLNEKKIDKIKLLGYRTDVAQILKGSDIFVLPSHDEAFGIVYIEAMAMGLPVIGCNSGGVPDIIIDEETGFMCKIRDTESLALSIKKILSLDYKKMGTSNIEYVEKFSMDKYIDNLIKIYGGKNSEKNR